MRLGVLLLAMGGPDRVESVEPYLQNVRGGRPFPPQFLEDLKDKYRLIGGKSPLLEISLAQASAVESRLKDLGARAYVGMRHWHPFIQDTLKRMHEEGVERVVAVCLAPQYSKLSIGAYKEDLEAARRTLRPELEVLFVESWHDHPLFLDAVAGNITRALERFPAPSRPHVLLTAHSLPERLLREGDSYLRQLEETAAGVRSRLGGLPARLVFQSKSPSGEPWLGPDAADAIRELSAQGVRELLMAPIGFVSDHLEILYDIDILYRGQAEALGMRLERMQSLNTHPLLIEALAELVRRRLALAGAGGPGSSGAGGAAPAVA